MTQRYESLALLNADMPSYWIDGGGVARTRNLGSLGGSIQLGDGVTPATFPTQVFPHGMSFDGGDYLLADNSSGIYNFTAGGGVDLPFSFEVLMRPSATPGEFFSKGGYTAAPGGWYFLTITTLPALMLTDAAGNFFYGYVTGGVPLVPTVQHVVATYTGNGALSGISMYTAGTPRVVVGAGAGVYGGLPGGVLPMYVGGSGAGGGRWNGSIFNAAIYPFVLTPGEVASLYRTRLGLLNRGA